jgi:hypothetical protein
MNRHQRMAREMSESNGIVNLAFVAGNVTYQVTLQDRFIRATSDQADGAAIITLPSLMEALGMTFFFWAPTGATGGDISLYEKETGLELATVGDLDADNDNVLLMATPKGWVAVYNGVA